MKKLLLTSIAFLSFSTFIKAQDSWSKIVTGGFDNPYDYYVNALHVFKGQIYAGTGNNNAEVFRSSTGNPGSWSKVFSMTNYTNITAINSTTQGGGYIYIASDACCSDVPAILRSPDGVAWSPYYTSHNYNTTPFIFPFNGAGVNDSMYVVLNNYMGDAIIKSAYNSNDPDNLSASWDTVLDFSSLAGYTTIHSYVKYNSKMYLGTTQSGYASMWSSADGMNWTENTHVAGGFGDSNNNSITALASHSGYIYAGTANNSDGAQYWRSNNDTTWSLVAQYPAYSSITSIKDLSGTLWVTATDNSGPGIGQVLKSTNDTTFVLSNSNGFGQSGISGAYASTLQFGNNIYWAGKDYTMPLIATGGGHGGSRGSVLPGGRTVWRLCTVVPSTISAGSDQTVCAGVSANFTAGAGFASYMWDADTLHMNQVLSTSVGGSHFIMAVDANGCDASDTVNLNLMTSPTSFVTSPFPLPTTICKGTSININTSSNSGLRTTLPTLSSTDSVAILDGGTAMDSIIVSGVNDDGINNTLVSVTIDSLYHTEDGDLSIFLYAPDGSYMTLSASSGFGSQNYIGTTFTPTATTYIGSSTGPFTGTFGSYDPFYYLSGPTNGIWKIEVYDGINLNQGSLKGWSLNFSQPDTNMTYSWSPTVGLTSTNTANTAATPNATTNYVLTVSNAIGCSTTDTVHLDVPNVQIAATTATVCYGGSTMITATGGTNYNWFPATSLDVTTGDTVNTNTAVNIMYYVTDTTSGCASIDSISVLANPILTATAGPGQSICYADTATLSGTAGGGTSPYTYWWYGGASAYNGQTENVSVITNTTYTLQVTDAAGCMQGGTTDLTVIPSTDIYGHVSYYGGSLTTGTNTAVIYKHVPFFTQFDTVQVQPVSATGDYHFTSINHGDYIIKIFADTLVHTDLDPTYFGNQWAWDSATVVVHDCSLPDTADIMMIHEIGLGGGPGFATGQITEGLGFGHAPSDPIPGVDVHLGRNPGGAAMYTTTTDGAGIYTFNNIPYNAPGEHYTVYVDIPGLGRDSSYSFVVDSAHVGHPYLDYYVDSTTIYIVPNAGMGISNPGIAAENKFNVYPNPFRENTTVEYTLSADAEVKLEVYNVLGTKINTLVSNKQQLGNYKYNLNNLNSGVYFITLSVDKKVSTQRVVVIE